MSKTDADLPLKPVKAMQAALVHRGPDGQGEFLPGPVALVHTRLSIIDRDHGQQPFVSASGVAVIANGEIYNDLDLRREFGGSAYQSDSDNESILHAYLQHGARFADCLRGMYAVAIYDPARQHLILARDPFGIKPLYYVETPQAFWYASEPHAFLDAGVVDRGENSEARDALFAFQFSTGTETLMRSVIRIAPGETIVVAGGKIVDRWFRTPDVQRVSPENKSNPDDFERIWMDAVERHCRSEVPYGLFLSGGLDSAAVLAAMARLESRPVVAYTAGFDSRDVHDEIQQASNVAAAAGADHRPVRITAKDFVSHLPAIAAALDDPVADYAIVPSALLARAAAPELTVVLTGEGGDEIFAGYGRYRAACRPWPFAKKMWARSHLSASGVLRQSSKTWRADIQETEVNLSRTSGSRLQKAQLLDVAHWLPHDLLTKVDRCLMAYGLEGRVPFLDDSVAEFGLNLADSDKVRGRYGKWIVRKWLERTLPAAQPFARKRGFSVPVAEWIASAGPHLGTLVAQQAGVIQSCAPDRVERLFESVTKRTGQAAWILLFYALWHQCHIVGRSAGEDIFSVLAET